VLRRLFRPRLSIHRQYSGNARVHTHIDAALVVIGADPPLAGEELGLIEAVGTAGSGYCFGS
jgi:hypothetical protein